MLAFPYLTLNSDEPYWVTRETFLSAFNQEDFTFREVLNIDYAYLSDWFHTKENTELYFSLPTVGVVSSKTQFINGRHRTAVLLAHLEEIPVAFAMDDLNPDARRFIENIPKRPLSLTESFFLPDLPICDSLP